MRRRRFSPKLLLYPVIAVLLLLLLLPVLLERWLDGGTGATIEDPLTQSELDASAAKINSLVDGALLRMNLGESQLVRRSTAVEQKEGLVWQTHYRESYLPTEVPVEQFTRELLAIRSSLPERATIDVVQPDPLRTEFYATVGKARIRHELFRVQLDSESHPQPDKHPNIALVLLPTGLDPPPPDTLDAPLTLGLEPFDLKSQQYAWDWTRAGHEVVVTWALDDTEDGDWRDAGQLATTIDKLLDAVPDRVGALLLGDTRSARDPRRMELLADDFAGRGLTLIDHWLHPGSLAVGLARNRGVEAAAVDMLLEASGSESLEAVLNRAAQLAVLQGRVLLAIEPTKEGLAALRAWIPQMRKRGMHFVFVYEALRDGPKQRADFQPDPPPAQ